MAKPFHQIPDPASSVAGRNNSALIGGLRRAISLWRPRGAREPGIATIARFAHRLIASDGKAYTADELATHSLTNPELNAVIEENAAATRKSLVAGFTVGNMLRVKVGGGLEERTPAQVRDAVMPLMTRHGSIGPPTNHMIGLSGTIIDFDGNPLSTPLTLSVDNIDLNGKLSYSQGGPFVAIIWDASKWLVYINSNGDPSFESSEDTETPDEVSFWTPLGAASGPDMTITDVGQHRADFIGQLCRVGDSAPYDLYLAETLTSWLPIVIGGAPVSWNADQAAYQALVVSGSSGSEVLTITTI